MSFQWSRADRSMGEGFLRIAREQIAKAIATAEDVAEPPERRVHEVRRRCKKLRALFRLVRPDFGAYSEANRIVRDASRGLAQARDTHVARRTLVDLMRWADRPLELPPEEDSGGEAAGLAEFAEEMRTLEKRSADWRVGSIDLDTLAKGLRHTYRRGRWTRGIALRLGTDEAFHDWRKYAKYHWNQLGLLEDCAEDVMPSAHRSAGELAELLGLHHDLAVLDHLLATAPESLAPDLDVAFARAALERRQREHEARIDVLGQQVFAETPKALAARFAAYLGGWAAREAAE